MKTEKKRFFQQRFICNYNNIKFLHVVNFKNNGQSHLDYSLKLEFHNTSFVMTSPPEKLVFQLYISFQMYKVMITTHLEISSFYAVKCFCR